MTVQNPDYLRRFTARFSFADRTAARRTEDIANTFLDGYNVLARGAGPEEVHAHAARTPRYFRPFLYEGAAMGYGPYSWHTRCGTGRFEEFAADLSPATLYQNYVGFGWWLATVYRGLPGRVARIVAGLNLRYRMLCYEGIGFRAGFMSAGQRTSPTGVRRGDVPATHLWYQGYGRSLWFVYMGDVAAAYRATTRVPAAYLGDCVSGLGVGVAYSWLDRIDRLESLYRTVPDRLRAEFEQGLSFGWEARQLADRPLFDEYLGRVSPDLRAAVDGRVSDVHEVRDALSAKADTTDFYNDWRRRLVEVRRRAPALFPGD
jgi:hypothetical protein